MVELRAVVDESGTEENSISRGDSKGLRVDIEQSSALFDRSSMDRNGLLSDMVDKGLS